jgi:hypothetical protein
LLAGAEIISLAQPRKTKMITTKGTMENNTPARRGEFAKLEVIAYVRIKSTSVSGRVSVSVTFQAQTKKKALRTAMIVAVDHSR